MAWYQIISAQGNSFAADREAADLIRRFSAAFRDADVPVDAEVFYGFTHTGARVYYLSLSPEAFAIAEGVLDAYEATILAGPPDLTDMQKIRSV